MVAHRRRGIVPGASVVETLTHLPLRQAPSRQDGRPCCPADPADCMFNPSGATPRALRAPRLIGRTPPPRSAGGLQVRAKPRLKDSDAQVEGRERDAVFETEECIHIIEATASRKKEKAQKDAAKLAALSGKLQRRTQTKAVRGWLVTRDEPTADQRKATLKYRPTVTILSFAQFQSLLVDSRGYLTARDGHVFGSVRDPLTGAVSPSVEYVELLLSKG